MNTQTSKAGLERNDVAAAIAREAAGVKTTDGPIPGIPAGAHLREFRMDEFCGRAAEALCEMAGIPRQDANEGFFFEEDLQQILTQVFNKKWPRFEARSKCTIRPLQAGMKKVKYRGYEETGMARMRAPGSTDLPLVDASGAQDEVAIRTNWLGANYDIEDLDASSASPGQSLDQALMMACRRGCEARYDIQLRFGDPGTGTTGLLNNAAVATHGLTNGDWLNAGTTNQEIIDDIEELIDDVATDTNGVHGITRMNFDSQSWRRITKPIMGNDSGSQSILDVVKKAHPEIMFERWYALNTAAGAVDEHTGLGGDPMIFAWEDDEEIVWSGVAREASPEAPQLQLATYTVFWLQRVIPGAVFTYPGAARYVTNHIA